MSKYGIQKKGTGKAIRITGQKPFLPTHPSNPGNPSRPKFNRGGRTNTRRENRLEELGRVDAERADTKKGARNLRDEKSRIVRELKADGGKVKRTKMQDNVKAHARDMQKTGRGKKFREDHFVDSKTGRVVPDSPRNRKRYGKDFFGRDTGRVRATTAKGKEKNWKSNVKELDSRR